MAFLKPLFVSAVDIWKAGRLPSTGAADFLAIAAQIYLHSRQDQDQAQAATQTYLPNTTIRMAHSAVTLLPWAPPYLTAVFKWTDPYAHAWYYKIYYWDYIHHDFANMYLHFVVRQCTNAGVIPDTNR